MINISAVVKRGKLNESVHEVKCLVKDTNFKTILSTNNAKDLVYPRSSIKIFQALPFVMSGAIKKYNLNKKILAISCSSHCGELIHTKLLKNWTKKISISINNLKCGIHNPINTKSSKKLFLSGNLPNQLHNNCAGKHLGMISGCKAYNMSSLDYLDLNHPYQKLIRDSLEYFMEFKIQKKNIALDGCSAPQYSFPIKNLATGMIKLKKNNIKYQEARNKLLQAITKYPKLIGGTNRFDSEVIEKTNGRIFCKGGAEGVLLFSDLEKNIGGVLKVVDGNERAIPPIAVKIFNKLNLFNKNEKNYFFKWEKQVIYNHAKNKVGEIFGILE